MDGWMMKMSPTVSQSYGPMGRRVGAVAPRRGNLLNSARTCAHDFCAASTHGCTTAIEGRICARLRKQPHSGTHFHSFCVQVVLVHALLRRRTCQRIHRLRFRVITLHQRDASRQRAECLGQNAVGSMLILEHNAEMLIYLLVRCTCMVFVVVQLLDLTVRLADMRESVELEGRVVLRCRAIACSALQSLWCCEVVGIVALTCLLEWM